MISGSLVLFHNDPSIFGQAITSFLEGCDGVLYIVDNSEYQSHHELFENSRVKYTFLGCNIGFGAAHNYAIHRLFPISDIHLILNPDVRFKPDVLPFLSKKMEAELDIGAMMPKVLYPNGELQYLCKLLPSPATLFFRRFIPISYFQNIINRRYELHALSEEHSAEIPSISGCFMLARTSIALKIGGFDTRYFMYMEDVDLVRRIGDHARILYEPYVFVEHGYAKGSYKNRALLIIHLKSAIKYFNKWGWFYDPIRILRNKKVIRLMHKL
ncbi:hypothetical protein AOC28_06920 [Polynucleobacter sp. MWH-Adler-W8]|nr:hypothetical protein AOC28_06920 [Polynucleobacter sp. MWH-Adler-W8]